MERKWSQVEYLHETVKNPNIIIKGTRSYYSNAWGSCFEDDVVRYLYGDEHSRKNWQPQWELDKLYIGNYRLHRCRGGYFAWRQQYTSQRLVFQLSFCRMYFGQLSNPG